MRGLKGTAKVWLLASKNYGMQRNFASLPRPARERPGQTWLRKLLSRGAAALCPAPVALAFGNSAATIGWVTHTLRFFLLEQLPSLCLKLPFTT